MAPKTNREESADKSKPPRMNPPPAARFIDPSVRWTRSAEPDPDEDAFCFSDEES